VTTIVCKQAILEVERTRSNVNRWWRLLYAFGVAVTIFSILLVVALIWGNTPTKYLSGLAAIASGAGVAFVNRSKNAALKEHEAAKRAVRPACGSQRGVVEGTEQAGVIPDEIIDVLVE
jgi:hypothetical protein